MGGTSYQMATTSHTRTSIVVSYKECCLHQNISLPPSRLLWQWSTERISGQQFQHIHRTHMYRHRECSQFVSIKVFNKGRLIKLNPWSTSCLQFRNNLPVFHNISHYQLMRIMLKKIVGFLCGSLHVDGKNATKKWKKRERFLHTLGRLREEQVWDWSNKHRDCINAELHEVQNHKFAGIIFIKENSMLLPLQGENHKHIRKKALQGILSYCHYATLNEKIVLWRLCITVKMAKSVSSKIVHLWLQIRFAKTVG